MTRSLRTLIIGLGNPGEKYRHNRHNVGHMLVDFVDNNAKGKIQNAKLMKSDSFMNESGGFVKKNLTANPYPLTAVYIVHDDLDIPLGKFKIQFGVGPKVHKGVDSIEQALGTTDFWRVRIGVDNRDPENRTPGDEYVLQDFTKEERDALKSLFPQIWDQLCNR